MKRSSFLVGLVVAGLALSSSFANAAQKIVIGAYPANPPWEFKNDAGVFEGYEIDVISEAAKRLGWEYEFVDMGFQALFAAISSHRIDFAVSTISITPERLQSQTFSQPYFDSQTGVISREDFKSLADLKGKIIGTLAGTTFEQWVKDQNNEIGFGEIRSYQTRADVLLDLQNGRIDAAVGDVPGIRTAMNDMPTLRLAFRLPEVEQYAIMAAKDSTLIDQMNEAISELKEDGTLAAIYTKWHGIEPEAGSSTVTPMDRPQAE